MLLKGPESGFFTVVDGLPDENRNGQQQQGRHQDQGAAAGKQLFEAPASLFLGFPVVRMLVFFAPNSTLSLSNAGGLMRGAAANTGHDVAVGAP